MSVVSEAVGRNIRKLRCANKLTLVEISQRVHKGKSTFSKYESGEISIDVETLTEIAAALNVSPAVLIFNEELESAAPPLSSQMVKNYIYFYDGRVKKIVMGLLEEYKDITGHGSVLMFFDIKDEHSPESCLAFYKGEVESFEFADNYSLINQNNRAERVWLCCLKNLRNSGYKRGVLSGLSYKTMLPVSIKILVSPKIIKSDEELTAALILSKEDIKLTKKYNMFTLCEPDF
ncbi:MAG: helix-turn-helix transcriptional regulator [Oscillospiraceae bacterium]